jgi:hypothetical protein
MFSLTEAPPTPSSSSSSSSSSSPSVSLDSSMVSFEISRTLLFLVLLRTDELWRKEVIIVQPPRGSRLP